MDLTRAAATIDAAGCQTATVEQIRARGGEYVVCVKGNRKGLRDAVAGVFERAAEADFAAAGRHSYVTGLLRKGATTAEARESARHTDVKTTMR